MKFQKKIQSIYAFYESFKICQTRNKQYLYILCLFVDRSDVYYIMLLWCYILILFKQSNQIIYNKNKNYNRLIYKVLVSYRTACIKYCYKNLNMYEIWMMSMSHKYVSPLFNYNIIILRGLSQDVSKM